MLDIFFFFSSRRRHTRCGRDWSSDVCSSDLSAAGRPRLVSARRPAWGAPPARRHLEQAEIGRASGRGKGEISGGAGSLKKKNNNKVLQYETYIMCTQSSEEAHKDMRKVCIA